MTRKNNDARPPRSVSTQARFMENMSKYIPGGLHQCKKDDTFTLLHMSDSFLTLLAYTREEIYTLFHDHFLNIIHPDDRASARETIRRQLAEGDSIDLEYRVLRKDGPPMWVLDKGRLVSDPVEGESFYCLLIENTDRKGEQEELRLSLERHQVIMDQTTDIIFEWDMPRDTLNFSPNWRKKFGYEPISTEISQRIPVSNDIHPDDMPAFVKIMHDTASGIPYSEAEFRIRNASGQYSWSRIRATTQYNSEGKPFKAVGVIIDIDNAKKQQQVLLEMAQKDALTGLYNKAAVGTLVERRMTGTDDTTLHALFILDVDYFKAVNDTYGHMAGDSLLSRVAATLKSHLRATDVVGRIGGDEFLVYLSELSSEAAARAKANELHAALGLLIPEVGAAPITCSIGVAVFPCGEVDYSTFYRCADQALYLQKNNGRNGVSLYDKLLCDSMPTQPQGRTAIGTDVVSDTDNVIDEQLAQYTFRTLYVAEDLEPTLNRLLEIIGRSFDVSRAYIFESSEDGRFCSNTFEWCASGVTPQMEQLQNISYLDDLGDYVLNFDAHGLFYCADIETTHPDVRAVLEPQGIRSMLQCAMLDEGKFVGYVGFDECRDNRTWTTQQVSSFKLTADVLSSFVVRLRQKQRLDRKTPST